MSADAETAIRDAFIAAHRAEFESFRQGWLDHATTGPVSPSVQAAVRPLLQGVGSKSKTGTASAVS